MSMPAISLWQPARFEYQDMGFESPCWVWTGATNENGYAILNIDGRRMYAHRVTYMALVGPIPNTWEIDHLCRVRPCINPAHLEAVESYVNSMRGEHPNFVTHREKQCRRGHDLTIDVNVYRRTDGRVRCRICSIERNRANRAARKLATRGEQSE